MNNVHFAIPEIYGEALSYYELLMELVTAMNEVIENYDTIPDQIAEAVKNLDAAQLFSAVLEQFIDGIATDNTKSANAVKLYKKHDLLYATFNDTVNLYESLIDFTTETELSVGTNIREVNISELFIELRELIDNETQTREQAETTLQNSINTETSERTRTDTTLQQNINAEASAREQADTSLQNAVNNEKSAREQADTTLQQNINAETTAREQADTALQQNINAEASAREQADTALQTKIDNGTLKIDLLWTNSNPNSDFSAQNISIDLNNYKMIYFEVIRQKNKLDELQSYILLNNNKKYYLIVYENVNIARKIELISNEIVVDDCRYAPTYSGASLSISNDHCIPYRIYGIK